MKIFSFYLPQFHEIPENNEWWGDGFTEWTNLKKAKPLFKGHKQPLFPLNNNFYDLMNRDTVLWQNDLLKQYHVDGFIFYHYYFNGKLLLEKPAQNLLNDKSINQPFFFCWANHSWNRAWEGKRTLLMEQTYGDVSSWEKHFQYLLPFFKDSRYEKKDNKPLFMIFLPFFDERGTMMDYFDKRCKEEGFDGIAVIDTIQDVSSSDFENYINNFCYKSEYVFLREPSVGKSLFIKHHPFAFFYQRFLTFLKNRFNIGNHVMKYSGDSIVKEIVNYKPIDKKILKGLFFEWDNTPRHGYRGYIIDPISKKSFNKLMDSCSKQDYVFINAWNEWCEGMVLEPTEKNNYKYLEWIKEYREVKGK